MLLRDKSMKATVFGFITFMSFNECSCLNSNKSESIAINSTNSLSTLIANNLKNCTKNNSNSNADNTEPIECQPKTRRRRYVAFPDGSTFSVAFCATVGYVGNPSFLYVSYAINWGLAYDLPNGTWVLNQRNQKILPKMLAQRRHRRDLYERFEVAIDNMGYNGRACILRALCESAQYFYKKSTNMVEELVRTIFTLPSMKVLPFEHKDLIAYDKAHRKGKDRVHCLSMYPECSFSLIGLGLGQYSKPYNFM